MKQIADLVINDYALTDPLGGGFTNLGSVVSGAIGYVFAFAGIGLLLMIIASGFSIMTAAGDAKKAEIGKARLTSAVTGFLFIFGSFWIVQLTRKILGWQSMGFF